MNLKLSTIAVATALTLGAAISSADEIETTDVVSADQNYVSLGLGYGNLNNKNVEPFKTAAFKKGSKDSDGILDTLKQNIAYNISIGHLFSVDSSMAYGFEVGFSGYPKSDLTAFKSDTKAPESDASKTTARAKPKSDDTDDTKPESQAGTNVTVSDTATSIDVLAVGKYYVSPEFNLNLKLGLAYLMLKREVEASHVDEAGKNARKATQTGIDGATTVNRLVPAVSAGVGYKIMDNLTLNLDAKYTFDYSFTGEKQIDTLPDVKDIKTDTDTAKAAQGLLHFSTFTVLAGLTYNF